jgi:uncharacterized alpha/beta hydrolase family protein
MNELYVFGGKKKEREVAEAVVAWSLKKLMPRMRTLSVTVQFNKLDAYGYCMMGDNNREFVLDINKGLNLPDLISTIVHEMIHVKQYARKELRYDRNGNQMWKKSRVSANTAYMDEPWEKEAYRLEKKLSMECFWDLDVKL